MVAEASAGVLAAAAAPAEGGGDEACRCASSRCAVVAEEAESEGAPVHPGGAERMGLPATPRGMMRRDGGGGARAGEAGADAEGAAGAEAEGGAAGDDGEAGAAAAAPLLFLAERAEAAFVFGLRRTGGCEVVFVFVFGLERGTGLETGGRGG